MRLTETFGESPGRYRPGDFARCKAHIHQVVETFEWQMLPKALVAVAGTATTLSAMDLGLTEWQADGCTARDSLEPHSVPGQTASSPQAQPSVGGLPG